MKIGTLLDKYFAARAERLALEKQAAEQKAKESSLAEKLREAMNHEKTERATSPAGTVTLKSVEVPKVQDWDAFYDFVHRHKAAHLLFRRVNEQNVNELLEHDTRLAKKGIPGLVFERVQKFSASAARR